RHQDANTRIALRLINTASGKALWTKIYEQRPETPDSVMLRAAKDIKAVFQNPISNSEIDVPEGCKNPQADEYLRAGKLYYYRYNPPDTVTSLQYFEKALQADADCAIAHAFFALGWGRHLEEMPPTATEDREKS